MQSKASQFPGFRNWSTEIFVGLLGQANQPITRPLPTQGNVNIENTQTYIHAVSGTQACEQYKTVHPLQPHMATVITWGFSCHY
jgi:hypothetical protein